MRFRLGLALGFGAGYYLGAKAGRERYEQMNRWINKVQRSDAYESATDKAKEAVSTAAEKAKAAAELGVERARDAVGGNGNGAPKVDVPDTSPPVRP